MIKGVGFGVQLSGLKSQLHLLVVRWRASYPTSLCHSLLICSNENNNNSIFPIGCCKDVKWCGVCKIGQWLSGSGCSWSVSFYYSNFLQRQKFVVRFVYRLLPGNRYHLDSVLQWIIIFFLADGFTNFCSLVHDTNEYYKLCLEQVSMLPGDSCAELMILLAARPSPREDARALVPPLRPWLSTHLPKLAFHSKIRTVLSSYVFCLWQLNRRCHITNNFSS